MLQLTREQGQALRIGSSKLTVTKVKRQKVQLEISRNVGQILKLDELTKIVVIGTQHKQVRLGIEAAKEVPIIREETIANAEQNK